MSEIKRALSNTDPLSDCGFDDRQKTPGQTLPSPDCPPDMGEILDFEVGLSTELRQLIEQAVARPDTTILTKELPAPVFSFSSTYQARQSGFSKFTPIILVEGPTYHDGVVTCNRLEWKEINKKRREIYLLRRLTLRQVRNVVMTEWCLFEKADRSPLIKKRLLEGQPYSIDLNGQNTFNRSVRHTIYTDRKDLMDRYLEVFHHYKT